MTHPEGAFGRLGRFDPVRRPGEAPRRSVAPQNVFRMARSAAVKKLARFLLRQV